MSEEEKKAIEYLNNNALVRINENGEIIASGNSYKIVILNLIARLQKELEQEKERNKELVLHDLGCFVEGQEKIKDKIKDKIKELEELFDKNEKEITIQYQNQFIVDVVGILEDLLKEN